MFNKAAAKKVESPKAKAKGVTWTAGDPNGDAVAKAVKELVRLSASAKALDAQMGLHKNVVKKYADDRFVRQYAESGVIPDTPMTVVNNDGEKVTYVVQDRSAQYNVSDEQKEALTQLLGADSVESLLYEEMKFSFNRDILALPGVMDAVGSALESVGAALVAAGTLTQDQAESLLDSGKKVAFRPGTLDRVAHICGRDQTRIRTFLEIMGSSATRYVKA
jgi:hypothetical protein